MSGVESFEKISEHLGRSAFRKVKMIAISEFRDPDDTIRLQDDRYSHHEKKIRH